MQKLVTTKTGKFQKVDFFDSVTGQHQGKISLLNRLYLAFKNAAGTFRSQCICNSLNNKIKLGKWPTSECCLFIRTFSV